MATEKLLGTSSKYINKCFDGGVAPGSVLALSGSRHPELYETAYALGIDLCRETAAQGSKALFLRPSAIVAPWKRFPNAGGDEELAVKYLPSVLTMSFLGKRKYEKLFEEEQPDLVVIEVTEYRLSHSDTTRSLCWLKDLARRHHVAIVLVSNVYISDECAQARIPVYNFFDKSDAAIISMYKSSDETGAKVDSSARYGIIFEGNDVSTGQLSFALDLFDELARLKVVKDVYQNNTPNLTIDSCLLEPDLERYVSAVIGKEWPKRKHPQARSARYSECIRQVATNPAIANAIRGWLEFKGLWDSFEPISGPATKDVSTLVSTLSYGRCDVEEASQQALSDELLLLSRLWNTALTGQGVSVDYELISPETLLAIGRDCGVEPRVEALYQGVPFDDLF